MHITELDWELISLILKQFDNYKWCIRFLMTCKQLYSNEYLIKYIKDYFTEYKVDAYGNQYWYFNNKLHRENDKPAIVNIHGDQYWYFNGKRHREEDKPAIINKYGRQWFLNGKCHRESDKPAIIYLDGHEEYWVNDKLHRDHEKPAIIYPCGSKEYWINGKFIKNE